MSLDCYVACFAPLSACLALSSAMQSYTQSCIAPALLRWACTFSLLVPCCPAQVSSYTHTHTLWLEVEEGVSTAHTQPSSSFAALSVASAELNVFIALWYIYKLQGTSTPMSSRTWLISEPTTWYGWGMPIPTSVLTSTRCGLLPYCYSNQHSRDLTKCQLFCAAKQSEISSRLCLTILPLILLISLSLDLIHANHLPQLHEP
jgi:hypothetical protein